MTDMTQRLAALPAQRRADFLAMLRAQADSAATRGPVPRGTTGPAPLSPAQDPSSTGVVSLCLRLRGSLDVPALRTALGVVVGRHEALRTAIVEREGSPMQVVAAEVPIELGLVDAADIEAARALVDERARIPFSLGRAPLWRADLVRIASDDHLFLFTAHHNVFDEWSLGVLTRELADVYGGFELPAPAVQYPDYAVWQQDRPASEQRDALAGAEALEFPTDRPARTNACQVGGVEVGQEGLELARKLAVEEEATPFDVLVAAFFTFLHRYTGLADLVIGTPDANRRHDAVSSAIGRFAETKVLRGDVSGDPTFRELVGRVKRLTPVPSDAPGIVFSLQDKDVTFELPGLEVSREPARAGTSGFDLGWNLAGERLDIEYDTGLFDADSIARFARHYDELLHTLTSDPDAPLSAADVLSKADKDFLAEVSQGPVRPVRETTVVEQFEARVAEAPDSVAVVVEGVETTYAELNANANRLAALLREHGAEPGATIGLCLRRNVDLPTAKLAILKTGAAYVPLDPKNPPARVAEIAADAGVRAVIAHAGVVKTLSAVTAPVVTLEDVDLAALPSENPPPAAQPGDVAYIIYTSGSTGRPKGVLLEHRGVVSFIDSTQELFELTKADRVLGFASATFDVSVFETFSALLTGARLYVATDDERLSIDRLQALMERSGITVIDLPPTVMPLLAPEKFTDLRIAFVGGEAFSGELVNRWNPGRRLFNGYGPTECTVTMIVEECAGTWDASPPIGLPMTNHVAHVLDRDLRQVPVGVPGELVIGGAGLARGYLNRPELTEEKFVADPFGTAPGGRLYRTGDLVKRLPDGRLVFLGRIDQQVKIRGLRIELGEVESALASFPGIGPVNVRSWADDAGDKHLVGYLTGVTEEQVPSVREHLGTVLPSYMIPSYFVVLDELPLTSSGKVDWRKLPAPDPSAAGDATGDEPRTETERALLRDVVVPLLRNDRFGVHDDFFQAGGNSLQAAQLMSAINRRFEVEVALNDFFVSPTVAHLAATIDAARASRSGDDQLDLLADAVAVERRDHALVRLREPSPARVILLYPSGGELFCYIPLVRGLREGVGVAGFAADRRDVAPAPDEVIATTVDRIVRALIATGEPESYCLAGWSYGGVLAFEVARRLEQQTGAQPPVVLLDAWDDGDLVPLDEPMVRQRFVHDVARLAGQDGPAVRGVLDDPAAGLADIGKTLASLGVQLELTEDELAARYSVFRACALALQRYRPSGTYSGHVSLLATSPREGIEERWRAVATGEFDVDDLPGDHYTLFTEPALSRVVAEIERALGH